MGQLWVIFIFIHINNNTTPLSQSLPHSLTCTSTTWMESQHPLIFLEPSPAFLMRMTPANPWSRSQRYTEETPPSKYLTWDRCTVTMCESYCCQNKFLPNEAHILLNEKRASWPIPNYCTNTFVNMDLGPLLWVYAHNSHMVIFRSLLGITRKRNW